MTVLLVILGLLPFAAGGVMNHSMMAHPDTLPPFLLIGLLLLLGWGLISFFAVRRGGSVETVVLSLNAVAALVLILLGVQELILGAYWMNAAGAWTQFFYLPLLNLGFTLTPWSHSVFPAYAASFILLAAASALGSLLGTRSRQK